MDECISCGKELEEYEKDFCDSCSRFFCNKYSTKCLEEQIKCHKRHAKKRRR
jgi:hypothetical protein